MGKKIIFITIISFITVITVITVLKLARGGKRLVSPLPNSAGENGTLLAESAAEEKTYRTVSYYITTSQGFLNKARGLANSDTSEVSSQTPDEKQKIIEFVNQALDIINQGIAAYPLDDRVFAQRAAIYQALTPFLPEAGKFAIQDLREAIKLNNQNPTYHTRLANLYLRAGDFEGAALAFYNAYQLAPTDLQILYNLADTLEKGGQLTKASHYFEKLLGLLPANDENQPKIRERQAALREAISKANLKYLSPPGEIAPAASTKQQEIIGTQELPLKQAATAEKVVIASDNPQESKHLGNEVLVNAKTGEGVIPAGKTEITIYNNNVKANSKIVVVPLEGDFKNRVLFVAAKKASTQECQYKDTPGVFTTSCGWFKVGVDAPPESSIKFKWWIIE